MMSISQQNLLKLARKEVKQGDLKKAIVNLEEALRSGREVKIVLYLCKLYCESHQPEQAYSLIKEEADHFSDRRIFKVYCHILAANHFLIEALELKYLRGQKLPCVVKASSIDQQHKIMQRFREKKMVTEVDYQQLFKLDLVNFKSFAQSQLLDPSLNFAVRLSLCEELVKLGLNESFELWILGRRTSFIPRRTTLLEKSTTYREVVAGIGSHFHNRPSQLPTMIGETNLILGSLYPKLEKYISDPNAFTSALISFIEHKDGYEYQSLFKKIYQALPK